MNAKNKIVIRTKRGHLIIRNADITDFIGSDGEQSSIAYVGRTRYEIIDRGAGGNIWGLCK